MRKVEIRLEVGQRYHLYAFFFFCLSVCSSLVLRSPLLENQRTAAHHQPQQQEQKLQTVVAR